MQETRTCQHCQNAFTVEAEDFDFYKKIEVPAPTFCPQCRLRRRTTWRNERTLYSRPCDACKKPTIGAYAPEAAFTVYCRECWWADNWDSTSFGKEYDFSRSFFEQYKELLSRVPRIALVATQNIDSDYANYSLSNKNAYLCFASHYNEDGAYLQYSNRTKNAYDCLHVSNNAEFVVDCNYCTHLYRCAHLTYADSCSDVILGYDLRGCDHCFGCVGLRQKSYYIFNEQYSPEEYKKKVDEITTSKKSFTNAREKFKILKAQFPRVFAYQRKCIDCTGNDLEEGKSLHNSFSIRNSEEAKYLWINCVNVKDSMDMNNIAYDPVELSYECQGMTNSTNMKFCDASWNGDTFLEYCNLCFSSQNLFGCVGIKGKKYVILNKEYLPEEYESVIEKIKKQMMEIPYVDAQGIEYRYGEFFPSELSPFAYNETIAMTYYPITKEEALAGGYKWRDEIDRGYKLTIESKDLSGNPEEYSQDLTKEVIGCGHGGTCKDKCTRAFRLLPGEIELYKSLGIQLPTLCPNCRNMERINARGPFLLFPRGCMCDMVTHGHAGKCDNKFKTTYSPDKSEIVYCEKCYQSEIV